MKLPHAPGKLTIGEADLTDWVSAMLRVHATVGSHALPWNQLRHYGPLSARFDPHPPPPRKHREFAVQYAAADLETALAEVFQLTRTVPADGAGRPYLTIWQPTRPVRLLDLTGLWPVHNGASQLIASGPHTSCRAWAHAIASHPAAVDGLHYRSTMTGRATVALFLPAANTYPERPLLSLPLDHPGLIGAVHAAALRIGYDWD